MILDVSHFNYEIAQALKNYQLAVGNDREAIFHALNALNALKRFKMIMDDKK